MRRLLLIALLLLPCQVAAQDLSLEFKTRYEPFEKIIIEADPGDIPAGYRLAVFWNVVDSGLEYEQVGDSKIHVWAEPGRHTIFVNMLLVRPEPFDMRPISKSLAFVVDDAPQPDPKPDPDGPDPPQPEPEKPYEALLTKIPEWANSVDVEDRAGQAKIIAAAFRKHGEAFEQYETIKEMSEATSAEYRPALGLNDYLAWRTNVLAPLIGAMNEYHAGGKIRTLADYAKLWIVAAEAFEKVK